MFSNLYIDAPWTQSNHHVPWELADQFSRSTQQRWEVLMQFSIARTMGEEMSQLPGLCYPASTISAGVPSLFLRALVSQGTAKEKDGGARLIYRHEKRAI
jgi:hypothetical protein